MKAMRFDRVFALLLGVSFAVQAPAQLSGGIQKAVPGSEAAVASSLEPWAAQVKVMQGHPMIEREGALLNVQIGMRLKARDIVKTPADAAVGLLFNDNSTLSIGPASVVLIQRFIFDTTTHQGYFDTQVKRGTVAVQTGQIARHAPDAMRVRTQASELRTQAASYVVNVPGGHND